MARRRCAALIGPGLNSYLRKACLFQLAMDQVEVVIAVRRASQKAWWIARKDFGQGVRYIVREHILLDAIPYVKQKTPTWLEDPLCLAVARLAVGEKHDPELTANQIENSILELQRQCICSAPGDATVSSLSRNGIVKHGLVQVSYDVAGVWGKSWRQCSRDHAAAGSGFQNGTWRKRSHSLGNILGEALEYQWDQITIVVFRDRTSEQLVGFGHGLPPVGCFMSGLEPYINNFRTMSFRVGRHSSTAATALRGVKPAGPPREAQARGAGGRLRACSAGWRGRQPPRISAHGSAPLRRAQPPRQRCPCGRT